VFLLASCFSQSLEQCLFQHWGLILSESVAVVGAGYAEDIYTDRRVNLLSGGSSLCSMSCLFSFAWELLSVVRGCYGSWEQSTQSLRQVPRRPRVGTRAAFAEVARQPCF
jgi:hypothetical protein